VSLLCNAMDYSKICGVYTELEATSRGLEKTDILAEFLGEIHDHPEFIYLLRGQLFADYDNRELGISVQLVIKAISRTAGIGENEVVKNFKELGDLGSVAEKMLGKKKKQRGLFEKRLSVEKVIENLRKLPDIEGSGTVDLKIGYIVDLLLSATAIEAKYIIRTVLGDLKIGVGIGILRDAIAVHCFVPEDSEDKKVCVAAVQEAYDKATDFVEVFKRACNDSLEKIKLTPGKPLKVMLFPKAKDVEDAFRIVGKPAAFEYKYDGFRVMVNKSADGSIKIFTRALEEVTTQFPEIVEYVKSHVEGTSFILDGEAVGFDSSTGEYTDFQSISQRIKRKYGIGEMRKSFPVELVVFDIVYLNGDNLIEVAFKERRKVIERIVREEKKKIVLAKEIVTSDEAEVERFYEEALEDKQEGLMGRNLDAPYKPGARIGYAVKLKPEDKDFDLVITGAEWGTGKRAGWLTSFDVSCQNEEGELLEVGKVSTGLKELRSDDGEQMTGDRGELSFGEMTDMLEKLVVNVDGRHVEVSPKIVVSVQFQNVQRSPTNSSGFALRFPRILRVRTDRGVSDIATVEEIGKESDGYNSRI
jgi:DNA ligase-1